MKKYIALALVLLIMLSSFTVCSYADGTENTDGASLGEIVADTLDDTYLRYLSANSSLKDAEDSLTVSADTYISADGGQIEKVGNYSDENGTARDGVIKWMGENGTLTYTFNVEKAGLYEIALTYCPIKGRGLPLAFSFKVDGETPYSSLNSVKFYRTWINENQDGIADGNGNIYSSQQIEKFLFKTGYAMDTTGQNIEPLKIALSAGEHTLSITALSGEFYLADLTLAAPEKVKSYSEVSAEYEKLGYQKYDGDELHIEGEDAIYKSTSSMNPLIDNSDPSVYPSEAFKSIINYIGGTGWKTPNETITWKVTAPKSGLYKMAFRFRQNTVINGNSYRELTIDGKTPFKEAQDIAFYYKGNWQFMELNVDDEPAYVYLTEGEHELSLTVTLGEFGEISRRINDVTFDIGNLYLKIKMITGETIDTGRSYVFFEQIEGFNETLLKASQDLSDISNTIEEITGQKSGTYVSTLKNMIRVIDDMYNNPYTAQRYISTYYDNYCSVCALVSDLASMPLDIDQIILAAPDKDYDMKMAGFWGKTAYSFERFVVSFMDDYRYTTKSTDGKTTLTLWTTLGNDQTQIIKSLIKDSFEAEHPDITVNVQIVGATLIQAILSGTGPDMLLGQARTEPVNYGMRGALLDLTQFDDFDEVVAERFQPSATEPYTLQWNDGTRAVYGLPDTQSFGIMYYRTDIFDEMGLTVPKTWDEFKNTSALLQRQNLGVALSGAGVVSTYATYIMQHGGDLYTPDRKATTLTDAVSVETFTFWTEFFTDLGFDTTFSFYNRFRSGTMPLGVSAYSDYVLFSSAAPEITGKWAIAKMPGHMNEDGTINYTQADTGTACVIPTISTHHDEAWEFLKWWTSDNIQFRYSTMVEAVLGSVGRVMTANKSAFQMLSWESNDLEILLDAWSDVEGLAEVPGGYYVERSIYQAFWNVINLSENPKDMIAKWGKVANEEITRKRGEYGLE